MTVQQFIRFLKNNDAYKAYIDNLLNINPFYIEDKCFTKKFYDLLSYANQSIIDYSLFWYKTKEGERFWSVLNFKLKKEKFV